MHRMREFPRRVWLLIQEALHVSALAAEPGWQAFPRGLPRLSPLSFASGQAQTWHPCRGDSRFTEAAWRVTGMACC
jgi:hypothetical protein